MVSPGRCRNLIVTEENSLSSPYLDLVPSPCFVLEEERLEKNLQLLHMVQEKSGAKVLLALKAFAMFSVFDLVGKYLSGAAASGLHEARLAREELGLEVHTFSPAIKDHEFAELASLSDHLIFNSFSQWQRFVDQKDQFPRTRFGIRVNPEHSEVAIPLYDPCARYSRLGVPSRDFRPELLAGISGLHFHTLCELGYPPLERTVASFEEKFGEFLPRMEWVNFGGGHHITRAGYDVDGLIALIRDFSTRHDVQVYLEPGEAISWQTGTLVGEVVDIVHNEIDICILDVSAATHMPDVLEMPYRPEIIGAGLPGEKSHDYRLAGPSCLAGDVIGDYSFDARLNRGDRLVFLDMIHYTMVKTNTFNGVPLPGIALWRQNGELEIIKRFGYRDFRDRLS